MAVFAHDPAAAADAVLRHLDGTLGALRTIHQLRTPARQHRACPGGQLVRARAAPLRRTAPPAQAVALLAGPGARRYLNHVAARIAVIEGDGIGREVIPAAIGVIRRLELGLEFQPLNVGAERYLQTGEALPEDDFAQLETADAILLGAIGDPGSPTPATSGRRWGGSAANWISTRTSGPPGCSAAA